MAREQAVSSWMRLSEALLHSEPGERQAHLVRLRVALATALSEGARVRVEAPADLRFSQDGDDARATGLSPLPVLVVWPGGMDDLTRTLAFAQQEGLGLVARAGSSWRPGRVFPPAVGLVVDFSAFDAIEDLDFEHRLLWVQGGASWGAIADFLEHLGLALATAPSSRFSTVAGWVATGGFGLQSTRYGHLSRWVEALDVVTPAGGRELIHRSHADFPLFFGSGGQLGLVGRVCLRVLPRDSAPHPHLLYFGSPRQALEFAADLLGSGVVPLHMKVMAADLADGEASGEAVAGAPGAPPPDSLLVVTDESTDSAFQSLLARHPACTEAQARFSHGAWQERYNPLRMQTMELKAVSVSVVLPPPVLAEYARRVVSLGRALGLRVPLEGVFVQVGDGYLVLVVVTFNGNRATAAGYGASQAVVEAFRLLARSLGGAAYGPHLRDLHFNLGEPDGTAGLHEARVRFDPQGVLQVGEDALGAFQGPCPACGSVETERVVVARVAPESLAARLLRGDAVPCEPAPGLCQRCRERAEAGFARRAVRAVLDEVAVQTGTGPSPV